jgi:hypothetical protein
LENDPFIALRDGGFDDLTTAVEQERDRIAGLVDRIYADEAFRLAVERDPAYELGEWGVPEAAMEAVLIVAGAPEEVIDRAAADFEAHLFGKKPASIAAVAAVLGTLAFAQQATASNQPELSTQVAQPALTAEIVQPALTTQVRSAVVGNQARRAIHGAWRGAAVKPAVSQNRLLSLLRAQNVAS